MIHTGDCVDVMQGMDPDSVDAIVTDPPYGLEFMGKEWDRLDGADVRQPGDPTFHSDPKTQAHARMKVRYGYNVDMSRVGDWHQRWATEALRVAKPGAYLLAFGGTRTVHRLTVALEDAGWIIRDMLVWAYASGFPKSKALLKPAWEPIVMARKPGPLRELAIDVCRIGYTDEADQASAIPQGRATAKSGALAGGVENDRERSDFKADNTKGRWPANLVLTDPIFDGDTEGVVGGGETGPSSVRIAEDRDEPGATWSLGRTGTTPRGVSDTGTYSRFFLIPKASRSDREPVTEGGSGERVNVHPT